MNSFQYAFGDSYVFFHWVLLCENWSKGKQKVSLAYSALLEQCMPFCSVHRQNNTDEPGNWRCSRNSSISHLQEIPATSPSLEYSIPTTNKCVIFCFLSFSLRAHTHTHTLACIETFLFPTNPNSIETSLCIRENEREYILVFSNLLVNYIDWDKRNHYCKVRFLEYSYAEVCLHNSAKFWLHSFSLCIKQSK